MDLSDKKISIKRSKTFVHKAGFKFPVEKRIEVVTKYLALGNQRLVAELTGVSYPLVRLWKTQPWWKEMEEEIKAARSYQLDNKLARIVDKSLETIADRLENGDVIFNQKTGTVVRKEVSLKDATKVATDLLTRQAVIQKQENEKVVTQNNVSIKDQLAMLALEFAKFNNVAPKLQIVEEVQDAVYARREEGLQEGSEGIHEQAGSEEEESFTECGETGDDEDGSSEEGGWEASGSHQTPEQGRG